MQKFLGICLTLLHTLGGGSGFATAPADVPLSRRSTPLVPANPCSLWELQSLREARPEPCRSLTPHHGPGICCHMVKARTMQKNPEFGDEGHKLQSLAAHATGEVPAFHRNCGLSMGRVTSLRFRKGRASKGQIPHSSRQLLSSQNEASDVVRSCDDSREVEDWDFYWRVSILKCGPI